MRFRIGDKIRVVGDMNKYRELITIQNRVGHLRINSFQIGMFCDYVYIIDGSNVRWMDFCIDKDCELAFIKDRILKPKKFKLVIQ